MLSSRGDHHLLGSSQLNAPVAGWCGHHHRLFLTQLMSRPKEGLGGHSWGAKPHLGQHSAACAKDGAVSCSNPSEVAQPSLFISAAQHLGLFGCPACCPCLRAALTALWLPAGEWVILSALRGPSLSKSKLMPHWFLFPSFLHLFYAFQFGSCISVTQAASCLESSCTPCIGDTDGNFGSLFSSWKRKNYLRQLPAFKWPQSIHAVPSIYGRYWQRAASPASLHPFGGLGCLTPGVNNKHLSLPRFQAMRTTKK